MCTLRSSLSLVQVHTEKLVELKVSLEGFSSCDVSNRPHMSLSDQRHQSVCMQYIQSCTCTCTCMYMYMHACNTYMYTYTYMEMCIVHVHVHAGLQCVSEDGGHYSGYVCEGLHWEISETDCDIRGPRGNSSEGDATELETLSQCIGPIK